MHKLTQTSNIRRLMIKQTTTFGAILWLDDWYPAVKKEIKKKQLKKSGSVNTISPANANKHSSQNEIYNSFL